MNVDILVPLITTLSAASLITGIVLVYQCIKPENINGNINNNENNKHENSENEESSSDVNSEEYDESINIAFHATSMHL